MEMQAADASCWIWRQKESYLAPGSWLSLINSAGGPQDVVVGRAEITDERGPFRRKESVEHYISHCNQGNSFKHFQK